MRAAYVCAPSASDPAAAIEVGELDTPAIPDGYVEVEMRAGALNMHDLWMLRGAVPLLHDRCVLGSDGAGVSGGRDVIVYPVMQLADPGPNVAHGTLVSDLGHGLLAERVALPAGQLVAKPAHLDWAEAAALPTAWLTAYRMLFSKADIQPGETVLVQGAGGGVATAAIVLAAAAGASVLVTFRAAEKGERALDLGAKVALGTGERVPDLVDVVIETVGAATFRHSVASARVGGRIVTCGSSTGFLAEMDLAKLFARELTVHGSTTGTIEEFRSMVEFVAQHALRPPVDSTVCLEDVKRQAQRMLAGTAFGKLCVEVS